MKKIVLALVTALSLLLTGCGGPEPRAFNDKMVEMNDILQTTVEKVSIHVESSLKNGAYASIKAITSPAIEQTKKTIADIQRIDAPDNGELFRDAVLAYLASLQAKLESYEAFSTLADAFDEAKFNQLVKAANKAEGEEELKMMMVQASQAEFAKEYAMTLK